MNLKGYISLDRDAVLPVLDKAIDNVQTVAQQVRDKYEARNAYLKNRSWWQGGYDSFDSDLWSSSRRMTLAEKHLDALRRTRQTIFDFPSDDGKILITFASLSFAKSCAIRYSV